MTSFRISYFCLQNYIYSTFFSLFVYNRDFVQQQYAITTLGFVYADAPTPPKLGGFDAPEFLFPIVVDDDVAITITS